MPFYLGRWILLRDLSAQEKGTSEVKRTVSRPKIVGTADGCGVVGHAGTRMLADLADATGLSVAMSEALAPLRQRDRGHDPGKVALDLAVMLADGGEAIADLAMLRNQSELFGPGRLGRDRLAGAGRYRHRRTAPDPRGAGSGSRVGVGAGGRDRPAGLVDGGRTIAGLVLDIDATIVVCHSDKEWSASTCSPSPARSCSTGEHALAEPKKLRYRLLHTAARLVRTARRTILRIARHWPWANQLTTAYSRLAALPQPVG